MNLPPVLIKYRFEVVFAGILVVSGFLNLWNIWGPGFSNEYYAAAVRSMMSSPALFFFNSFDPAGFVTVDKPPVGLWVQVVSATIFGLSGWSQVVPQALAGIGSVALVYLIISPRFGKPAGLLSAFALAVTPISVAVARNGTMDMQLIFFLLLATWAALRASRERSLAWLLISAVLIGVGFNIKMIQAFIIVPAVLGVYLLGTKGMPIPKRAAHVIFSICVLLCVSLSWAIVVDMVPAKDRPFIGGSGDNTVLGLIIDYNGLHRLENGLNGPGDGPGGSPLRQGDAFPGMMNRSMGGPGSPPLVSGSGYPVNGNASAAGNPPPRDGSIGPAGQLNRNGMLPTDQSGGGTDGGMMQDTGIPGLSRLFSGSLAGQLTWLMPFALLGLLAWWRRPVVSLLADPPGEGLFGEKSRVLAFMILWLLPGLAYFSFTTGFWHPYYIATIAPPLAALVGIGAIAMIEAYRPFDWRGAILIISVLLTGVVEVRILSYYEAWAGLLIPGLLAATIMMTVLLSFVWLRVLDLPDRIFQIIPWIAVAILFVGPCIWACTPLSGNGGALPSAGPLMFRGSGAQGMGDRPPGSGTTGVGLPYPGSMNMIPIGTAPGITAPPNPGAWNTSEWNIDTGDLRPSGAGFGRRSAEYSSLAQYLVSHHTSERWYIAVASSHEATSLILDYNIPVMAMGGFSGTDQILTVGDLRKWIQEGKIRYFLITSSSQGGGMTQGNAALFSYIRSNSMVVPASEWSGKQTGSGDSVVQGNITAISGRGESGPLTLYDCRPDN